MKPNCYVSEGVRVVRNRNIRDDRFDASEFKFVTDEKFRQVRRSEVRAGDLLISTKGTIGNVCLMLDLPGSSVLSATGTVRVRASEGAAHPEFLVSQMTQSAYKRYMRSLEAGTNQKYLNLSGVRSFRLILPPLDLQEEFLRRKRLIRELADRQEWALIQSETLFHSLVHCAFSGEL